MTAKIIDGRAIAKSIRHTIKTTIANKTESAPALAVVLVGSDPASEIYVKNKIAACEEVGIHSISIELDESISQEDLLAQVEKLNADDSVDGILVQLPLPAQLDVAQIISAIDYHKDVDGFHPYNLGRLAVNNPLLRPCTPLGIINMLNHEDISISGNHCVMVGASKIVGRPMALEFIAHDGTVTICHRKTRNLQAHVEQADILVVAIGNPDVIRSEWIKPGCVVIDVGINRKSDGKICGDIDFDTAVERASYITPVPGGVGPMTIASLLQNTLTAASLRRNY